MTVPTICPTGSDVMAAAGGAGARANPGNRAKDVPVVVPPHDDRVLARGEDFERSVGLAVSRRDRRDVPIEGGEAETPDHDRPAVMRPRPRR